MAYSIDTQTPFEFRSPVKLCFAAGAVDRVGEFAAGTERVLVVTGRSSARKSGLLDRACAALADKKVTVFDQVEPNPSIETCERGANLAVEAAADLVIGLGGGSAMDAAKVIAAIAPNSGSFRTEYDKASYANPPIRLLAIPTTCGTGSEANQYAIITDTGANDKVNFSSDHTYPAVAVLDPTVLDGIPREILVATAIDAFTHAFEGFTSRRSQPVPSALAAEAMGLILHHLPRAADGDRDGKANLLYASSLAGIVIAHTGTTMLHALGYYLTLRHDVPHGKANAALIPLLLEHLETVIPDKVRSVLDLLPEGGRSRGGFAEYLNRLGIETALRAHGVQSGELDDYADYVLTKSNAAATVGTVDKRTLVALLRKYA